MGSFIASIFASNKQMQDLLPDLLIDRTTGKNIVWATDSYEQFGAYYRRDRQMFPDFNINLILSGVLLPRIQKTKDQQKDRTKAKAEVFTPSWICNLMNNYCDEEWFGTKDVFNIPHDDHTWTHTDSPISFKKNRNKHRTEWQKYVDSRRIEITCGEAPFLVSRYDTTTGEEFAIKDRIGLLDRKLRVINENTSDEATWLKWVYRAYEAIYGFEYQGDNLFFARINLLLTFIDYYKDRWGKEPDKEMLKRISEIISWNIWQMDGLKDTTPYGIPDAEFTQMSFDDLAGIPRKKEEILCCIKDWRAKKVLKFRDIRRVK